jgi:hypothetical protein
VEKSQTVMAEDGLRAGVEVVQLYLAAPASPPQPPND